MFGRKQVTCYRTRTKIWRDSASALVLGTLLASMAGPALANPLNGKVVAGQATIAQSGSTLTVNQDTDRAIIDWSSFSIENGETTRFVQPSANAVTANRVTGVDPSAIMGNLEANGTVVLVNANGIVFGKNSRVDAAGLVATVHDFANDAFMSGVGELRFSGGAADGAEVVNMGTVTISDAGLAAFVAPHVRNQGTIRADLGRVALASAQGFSVDLYGDGLLSFAPGDALKQTLGDGSSALVENAGTIEGGQVLLSARAAQEVVNASINVSGVVRATTVSARGGVITLGGSGSVAVQTGATLDASGGGGRVVIEAGGFSTDGTIDVSGVDADGAAVAQGGSVAITAGSATLGGLVTASGTAGGTISVEADGLLSLAEQVEARGVLSAGGAVTYRAGRIIENASAVTDVSALTHGGTISVDAATRIVTSGTYAAMGLYGRGGRVDMTAPDLRLLGATIEASGRQQGGLVRLGGAFQGGKTSDPDQPYHDSFRARWGDLPSVDAAERTFVNDGTRVNVSAWQGQGGTAIVWSDIETTALGAIDARGTLGGGSVELSSAQTLRRIGLDAVKVGNGHLLLDPQNIVIGTAAEVGKWTYAGIVQAFAPENVSDASNVNLSGELDAYDGFGRSVALNAGGTRLAVGSIYDDGTGVSAKPDAGAVYLFSFTDENFSGGQLAGAIGSGYTGGNNIDLSGKLDPSDLLGSGVALNADGTRLAVGAQLDDGNGNAKPDAGAIYLFSFTDENFSGGQHTGTIGSGYTGSNDIDLSSELGAGDWFGTGVALNADGTHLAAGAVFDDGTGASAKTDAGAVHLFSFTDENFSGGQHTGTIGSGYTGGNNIDLSGKLDVGDWFGASMALNADGTRLAVGAYGDDGISPSAKLDAGAVHLFSFIGGDFSAGQHTGTIGSGYAGGNDVDLSSELDPSDWFGIGLALNADGTRLAVGAYLDDGITPSAKPDAGAVYLFNFADENFSGGQHTGTIGSGYTGSNNIDLSGVLDPHDRFGTSVALNADGTRLAVGAYIDDGYNNQLTDSGAVYLFTAFTGGPEDGDAYDKNEGMTVTIAADAVAAQLAKGASVTLQASNDITVNTAIAIADGAAAQPGALTLQAGRSILVNAGIDTAVNTVGGSLTLIANDTLANGVVDADRLAGAAVIEIATGVTLDAGTADLLLELRDGAGKTNAGSGDITIAGMLKANTITAVNAGSTAGSGIVLATGASLEASGPGDAIVLAGAGFTNAAGAGVLAANAGHWQVWSGAPTGDDRGGIAYDFKQYNAVYGTTAPAQDTGNGIFYQLAPQATATLTGAISKTYDGTTGATIDASNYTVAGAIDGDTIVLRAPASVSYDNKNVGTGKIVTADGLTVTAANGATNVYGYTLAGASVSGAIGEITAKFIDTTLGLVTRVYDGTDKVHPNEGGITLGGIIAGDAVTVADTGGTFDNKNVGIGKFVTVNGIALSGADAANYVLSGTTASGNVGTITQLASVQWTGGGGDTNWFNPANWENGAIPDLSNVAKVILTNGVDVTFDDTNLVDPAEAGVVKIDELTGDPAATGHGLTMAAGTLEVGTGLDLGSLTQTGGTIGGMGSVTVTEAFSQTGGDIDMGGNIDINQNAGDLVATSLTGEDITLTGPAKVDLGKVDARGILTVSAGTDLHLGGPTDVGGDFNLAAGTTGTGGITQSERIVAGGTTAITASDDIVLTNPDNDFKGNVGLKTDGKASIADINDLDLAKVDLGGNLTVSTGDNLNFGGPTDVGGDLDAVADANGNGNGGITQNERIVVEGDAGFKATDNIILDNPDNDFKGPVTAVTDGDIKIADINDLDLGEIDAGGNLTASGGNNVHLGGPTDVGGDLDAEADANGNGNGGITQKERIVVEGDANFKATDDIVIDNPDNDFKGNVGLETDGDASIADINDLDLSKVDVDGNLTVSTGDDLDFGGPTDVGGDLDAEADANGNGNGGITQKERIVVEGDANFDASEDIILTNPDNRFGGNVVGVSINGRVSTNGGVDIIGMERDFPEFDIELCDLQPKTVTCDVAPKNVKLELSFSGFPPTIEEAMADAE